MTKQLEDGKHAFRWLLINNQETCFMSIVKLIDGYYVSSEEAQIACPDYNFKEHLFRVSRIEDAPLPVEWVVNN